MQNNATLRYVFKAVIVILAVVIYYVIDVQAGIRLSEAETRDESRERMSVIKEALNHYAGVNKRYTEDFDTLLVSVKTDSILNRKILLVDLTKQLLDVIENGKNIPLYNNTYAIKSAIKELKGILEEISDSYKQYTDIMEKTLSISEDIDSFENQDDFFDFASVLNISDSINYLSIEVNDFTLQEAVEQSGHLITLYKTHAPNINVSSIEKYWANIHSELKALENLLTAPDQSDQVFTNRYLKHIEIIQKRIVALKNLDVNSEAKKFETVRTEISKLRDKFSSEEYFTVTSLSAMKGLEKDEQILVRINENTIFAPPVEGQKFKIEITNDGLGYRISCPNDRGEFNVGIFSQRFMNYGNIDTGEKSWEAN